VCFFVLESGFHSRIIFAVIQDAWARIRVEQAQGLEAVVSHGQDEDLAELARATQGQLNGIMRECTDSVFQLRSSMSNDVETVRSSVEEVQRQLDTLKHSLATQKHERPADAVTPGILAAAVAALERHVNEYAPIHSS
jgi:hypothetical protein